MSELSKIRKRFFDEKLTAEDLQEVEVLRNRVVQLQEYLPKYGGIRWIVKGFGELFNSGESSSLLCNRSKKFMRAEQLETCMCDLLVLKHGGNLHTEYLTGGFYDYNSHRQLPDSIVSFKKTIEHVIH